MLPGGTIGARVRWALLNVCGAEVDWLLHIDYGVWIRFPEHLAAGSGLVISRGSVFNCAGGITFGENCLVGYGSYVGTASQVIPDRLDEAVALAGHVYSPVSIGDGCWLGAHTCVLPGVSLARGCVSGAGAVITHDFGPGAIVVGVPAKVHRMRSFAAEQGLIGG